MIKDKDPKDIGNLDETGLYYIAGRTRSYVTGTEAKDGDLRGKKQMKQRVTVLVGGFLDGTKMPLLVIGKSAKPISFKNKKLPYMYRSQDNAWITCELFNEYLEKRNNQFKNENRHVILFIENCSAHPKVYHFSNIKVIFSPPNVTSKCQPCDMGIIHSLKSHYKNKINHKKLSCLDNNVKFEVNMHDCLGYLAEAWNKVTDATIRNCFHKAKFDLDVDLNTTIIEDLGDEHSF